MGMCMGEEKNSGIAVVLSFFIPGLGQIYNGQIGKGILIIVLDAIFVALSYILIGIPFYLALWIYGMYNAYNVAEATHTESKSSVQNSLKPSENEKINILKKRYASGEITKSQYERIKKDLE